MMKLFDDLTAQVRRVAAAQWAAGSQTPQPASINLDLARLEDRVLMSATPMGDGGDGGGGGGDGAGDGGDGGSGPEPQEPPQMLAMAQNPLAFIGAEGLGAEAVGGRGGDVYHVTNLNDSGSGSLRHGIDSASGPRTIVFDVSGTIEMTGGYGISNPYLTIAGQTAPGDGITLKGYDFVVHDTHDVVIRYLRFRPGDFAERHMIPFVVRDSSDIIVDHVSVSWGTDETLATWNSTDVTVQWSFITEGLFDSGYNVSGQPHGSGSDHYAGEISLHHNLYAHNYFRSPLVTQDADIVNNVIYNWGTYATLGGWSGASPDPNGPTRINLENNYYVAGPDTIFYHFSLGDLTYAFQGKTGTTVWESGNLQDDTFDSTLNGTAARFVGAHSYATNPFGFGNIAADDALTAYYRVLSNAGASISRDAVDLRIVQDVVNQSGNKIDSQDEVGGWPTLNSLPAPVDTDQDGMPDYWESAFAHLDSQNAADRNGDYNNDGYTNLEDYLHQLTLGPQAPVAVGEAYTLNEDTVLTVTLPSGVLQNDFDINGGALAAALVAGPEHGTLQWNSNGTFIYTPDVDYNGSDSFTYRAFDGGLFSAPQTVQLTVHATHDPPIASQDRYTLDARGPLVVPISHGVLANDTPGDGGAFQALLVDGPLHGDLAWNDDGSFMYTPGLTFDGSDQFRYRVYDGEEYSTVVAVSIVERSALIGPQPYDPNLQDGIDATVFSSDVSPSSALDSRFQHDATWGTGEARGYAASENDSEGWSDGQHRGALVHEHASSANSHTYFFSAAEYNEWEIQDQARDDVSSELDESESRPSSSDQSGLLAAHDGDTEPQLLDPPHLGALTVESDGVFVYQPQLNTTQADAFRVSWTDSIGNEAVVEVQIQVEGSQDHAEGSVAGTPVVVDDSSTEPVVIAGPHDSEAQLGSDGQITWKPGSAWESEETWTFQYQVQDDHGQSKIITVTVRVVPVQTASASPALRGTDSEILAAGVATSLWMVTGVDRPRDVGLSNRLAHTPGLQRTAFARWRSHLESAWKSL